MAITIKIEQDPDDPNLMLVDLIPPEDGQPWDQKMLDLARILVWELMEKLNPHVETCPECQADQQTPVH